MFRGCSLRGSASRSEPQAPHSLALLLMRGFKSPENQRFRKKKKTGFWVSFLKSLNMRTKNRQPRMPRANPRPRPRPEKQLEFSTRAPGACRQDQEHGLPLRFTARQPAVCFPQSRHHPCLQGPCPPSAPTGALRTSPEQGSWTTGPGRRWASALSTGPGVVTGSGYRIAKQ